MNAGYELFDHTADVGVRAFAPSMQELVRVVGQGLYSVIGDLVPEGQPKSETFTLTGGDAAELLRDYLAELLLLFDSEYRIVTDVRLDIFEPDRLVISAESRAVNRDKSAFDREVKAVTYHGLAIRPIEDGFEVTYIVDI